MQILVARCMPILDEIVKSLAIVIPAEAGTQCHLTVLDSRLRGNDGHGRLMTFYDVINSRLTSVSSFSSLFSKIAPCRLS
jgi:hypothetical protein